MANAAITTEAITTQEVNAATSAKFVRKRSSPMPPTYGQYGRKLKIRTQSLLKFTF